ncbi:CD109 antigen-like [Argopecten irradians]|uniref:CD109 antigen-like n=1 Tax=Argopecten irradians TaxID=31199 RepID=UPI00371C1368
MLRFLLLGAALLAVGYAQSRQTVIDNQVGYKQERAPTYLVIAPKRVRPNQVVQIFVTILKLEYSRINVRVSITRKNVEYAGAELGFEQIGSRTMQLHMPQNSQTGDYKLRVEGTIDGGSSGNVFENETSIEFHPKQASLFIQLSKPIFRQGQKVYFRVVPILPNLMPKYGSMTIYVNDPTGFPVRRWLAVQTNAGGILSQNFVLSDQPNYGNWSIQVDAFGYTYFKHFLVEEYWDPRFDVNVTVRPYIMDNVETVGGVINANMTTGKPVEGNATVVLSVMPPPDPRYENTDVTNTNPALYNPITITQVYSYVKGPIAFNFKMSEILEKVRRYWPQYVGWNALTDFELQFNASVYDWFYSMTKEGYASTTIFSSRTRLQWVGDHVRTFKPETVMNVHVAVMKYDGTPVSSSKFVRLILEPRYSGGAGNSPIFGGSQYMKTPVNGIVKFSIPIDKQLVGLKLIAQYDGDPFTDIQMMATKFYSPSNSFITVSTSTGTPKINEYMIFHVKTSNYIPRIYYQIVAGSNIIVGEELEMMSRRKTFSIALSKEMVPTARIVVYYVSGQPEEIVIDTLTFSIDGMKSNQVGAKINRGKDFTRDTVEIMATADPGSYVAFAAMPSDLYTRGINDGLTEYNLVDELNSYDEPARGSYQHLWRLSETEYQYKFFLAQGYGIDSFTTFRDSGLLALSDVTINRVPNQCELEPDTIPCFDGTCYHKNKTCDGNLDCPTDWSDEENCPKEDPRYNNKTVNMINRVSRVLRFYEDSGWAWQEYFTKPDGEVDFRVNVPKYPLEWVVNGISMSRNLGLGLMPKPLRYDATRYMYIIVESATHIIRGEQIGVRVTVFNYWYASDFIEVLVTMEGSPDYDSVLVGEEGFVTSYSPTRHNGDHQTIVFLEPGESKDILMPIVPNMVQGNFTYTVSAWCFLERDSVTKQIYVTSDGVLNYHHTPCLIDMITYGSIIIPDLKVNVSDQFITPEQRYHNYVPGSGVGHLSLFGDVVTPGFFVDYPTAEDIMYRPYGAAEMNMFNFAFNLITLKFKKANQQLPNDVLKRTLHYMNIGLQRQLSYMKADGSFKMFRDDNRSSIWLTAFVAQTLHEARFGEWEKDLFIKLELINKIVVWICEKQNNVTGEFYDNQVPVYDRNYASRSEMMAAKLTGHPVPLTAYVLIALYKITDVSEEAQSCIEKARQRASEYLSTRTSEIEASNEIFHMAITAYALSLSQQRSRTIFDKLWAKRKKSEEFYFADDPVRENPSDFVNTVRYLLPRVELMNDAHAVQSTAYALMAHINHFGSSSGDYKVQRDSMMRWLQTMRNYIGAFASSQDTLAAMESLYAFTQVDPNRNVFDMFMELESSASPEWKSLMLMNKHNYTNLQEAFLPKVYGQVRVTAKGTGRALIQLTTTVNVEYAWQIKNTVDSKRFYLLDLDYLQFSGRNFSTMEMMPCVSWIYTQKSMTSGLSVLEIDMPSGYVVMNDTLRNLVLNKTVRNLQRAEFYNRKVVFYFDYLDQSRSCVRFQAHRWYPVANMTIQHKMRLFDYYEPGFHNTTMYTTYNLFNLNICYVCGSYQCPYCPFFNVATILKASFTMVTLIIGFLLQRYILRVT